VSADAFAGFDLESGIVERAHRCGLDLHEDAIGAIATHARAVLEHNELLHLTTVTEPEEFLERHIGESIEGAAMLDTKAQGRLVDLGSGNGYPAIPIAAIRRGLDPVCVEASEAKASFLTDALQASLGGGRVWNRQVQRRADFEDDTPIRVLTSRAMGNWERIFPRTVTSLAPNGVAMLWAGDAVKQIATRAAWRRMSLVARHALPGRARSWIWCFSVPGEAR
jgi:16S rRNA G527 N7-methylase RsmG